MLDGGVGVHTLTPIFVAIDEFVRLSILLHVVQLLSSPSTTHGSENSPLLTLLDGGLLSLTSLHENENIDNCEDDESNHCLLSLKIINVVDCILHRKQKCHAQVHQENAPW
ncbi:hypothetical protein MpV1_150 [Micromonas sp. RCC1109 virus MpV1]|uniref:hypothetical protein n=1 Tax=Micromonas sp. RCC1109 virus MpV1 TaxID=880161 RepID=UPI0001EF44AF|nr:hypothetical protein MpV1_150 [Micromonas sp. RCC1109 virus MpV1]ADQ91073.1 hypothetical protein MpV1_150 [Micromonas sp. RCC1109 virus MpV1]